MTRRVRREWSPQEDDRLKAMYRSGWVLKAIADELDRPIGSVFKRIDKFAMQDRKPPRKAKVAVSLEAACAAEIYSLAKASHQTVATFIRRHLHREFGRRLPQP